MKYTFSGNQPQQHFLQITFEVNDIDQDQVELQLPAWRPGRYELGNFAKNVRKWEVTDSNGNSLSYEKVTKDRWLVETAGVTSVKVDYTYYAAQLDAGACWLDEAQMYVNPVHCCLYMIGREEETCHVMLNIPDDYRVATSMEQKEKRHYTANNIQELVDSPFIASDSLHHNSFECEGVLFHIWFQGELKPDWDRLLKDYKAYTVSQIAAFGNFPVKEYHYLTQVTPHRYYHGVEHQKSTVIALGPPYAIFGKSYDDLMGVSCHELYHTWNIKNIRPAEMYPYDLARENYSRLGYVAEGVTTYFGDQMLHRSGVFTDEQYFKEINKQLQRHFDNDGRHNKSVAESSFDTWLDGYVKGVPGRKVSIYTEGCLLAMVADILILDATDGQNSLDDVMRLLYERFAKQGKGYTEADYLGLLEEVGGISFKEYTDTLLYGIADYTPWLEKAFHLVGLEMKGSPSKLQHEAKLGIKVTDSAHGATIQSVYPGSPAEMAGLWVNDQITAVNGFLVNNDLEDWVKYFGKDELRLILKRDHKLKRVTISADEGVYYRKWEVNHQKDKSEIQQKLYSQWSTAIRK